jgi:hypothetical protein
MYGPMVKKIAGRLMSSPLDATMNMTTRMSVMLCEFRNKSVVDLIGVVSQAAYHAPHIREVYNDIFNHIELPVWNMIGLPVRNVLDTLEEQ